MLRPQAAASSRSRLSYSIAAWRFHVGCVTRPIAACFGQEGAAACTAPTARADAASTRRRASRRGRARLVHVPSHPLYSHMVTRLLDGACARRPYLHWASPHPAVASKAPLPKSVVWHRAFCDAPPCSKYVRASTLPSTDLQHRALQFALHVLATHSHLTLHSSEVP